MFSIFFCSRFFSLLRNHFPGFGTRYGICFVCKLQNHSSVSNQSYSDGLYRARFNCFNFAVFSLSRPPSRPSFRLQCQQLYRLNRWGKRHCFYCLAYPHWLGGSQDMRLVTLTHPYTYTHYSANTRGGGIASLLCSKENRNVQLKCFYQVSLVHTVRQLIHTGALIKFTPAFHSSIFLYLFFF